MRILLTSQIQPSGSDSTGYWIDLKLHAPTYFEPNFTKIQDWTWFDHPCLQTNDFLIIDFFMKNQKKNFDYFKPYHKVYTWLESSPRAYKRQIFQKLYFGNVQFRKSNFIFTIPTKLKTLVKISQTLVKISQTLVKISQTFVKISLTFVNFSQTLDRLAKSYRSEQYKLCEVKILDIR